MKIRLAREMETDSIVDGEGIRTVIWTQGCIHNCLGCHNPETHSFSEGFLKDIDALKKEISALKIQDGITLSGGDPLCQIDAVLELSEYIKSLGLNIWCYTGYTFEVLLERSEKEENLRKLLNNIDVIIDGKFVLAKKSFDVVFRGSTNQRIIDVKKSLKEGKPVQIVKYTSNNKNIFKRKTYV